MNQRSNWIAFVGPPNAGKSTLVNKLVGEKISIVSPKVQTTRNSIKGIKIIGDTQLVFIDTPGIFNADTTMGKLMVKMAWNSVASADEICILVDAKQAESDKTAEVLEQFKSKKLKCTLILNKIDKCPKPELLRITAHLSSLYEFKNIFMISALRNDGVTDLLQYFLNSAETKPWLFSEETVTSAPLSFMVTEILREKIFFNTHNELPYSTDIEIEKWEEKQDITVINANILVRDQRHKKIVIGSHASMIKEIGSQARKDIERLLNNKVYLQLNVKTTSEKHLKGKDLPQY